MGEWPTDSVQCMCCAGEGKVKKNFDYCRPAYMQYSLDGPRPEKTEKCLSCDGLGYISGDLDRKAWTAAKQHKEELRKNLEYAQKAYDRGW